MTSRKATPKLEAKRAKTPEELEHEDYIRQLELALENH
jgi:hypothetical protein